MPSSRSLNVCRDVTNTVVPQKPRRDPPAPLFFLTGKKYVYNFDMYAMRVVNSHCVRAKQALHPNWWQIINSCKRMGATCHEVLMKDGVVFHDLQSNSLSKQLSGSLQSKRIEVMYTEEHVFL